MQIITPVCVIFHLIGEPGQNVAKRAGVTASGTVLAPGYAKEYCMKKLFTAFCLSLMAAFIMVACKKDNDNTPPTPANIDIAPLAQNLSQPWEILWGPDNTIWVSERGGKISRVDTGTGNVSLLHTISEVDAKGEGGLLGMAIHPQFATSPYVYVVYNYSVVGDYREKVVRFTFAPTKLSSPLTIIDNIKAANIHNGSRLIIIGDKLYITTGDASNTALPQDNNFVNGKILRVNLDGSIPADNPITGSPIWSSGHRNPQGLVFANNILYSSEHGPDSDDEVNIIEKGGNYGWPNVKGYCNESAEQSYCTAKSVKEPLKAWTPTIAVSGMDYYNSDYIPQWKNSLLVATLKNSRLMQLKLNDDHKSVAETNEFFANAYGRMRDLCISPDGKVYICTGNGSNDRIVVVRTK